MQRIKSGFTLVELMVVIGIISILAVIVYANISTAGPKARDAERQADLRNLQNAITAYKQKNGRYPAMGCTPGADLISGENDCATYITGLAPQFITVLLRDPKRGAGVGYAYVTNTDGTSYKIMAVGTVESETITPSHTFRRCDNSGAAICPTTGVCAVASTEYQKTYALWGGFADGSSDAAVKTATAQVICK